LEGIVYAIHMHCLQNIYNVILTFFPLKQIHCGLIYVL
jgi:hypothetical protein